MGDQQLEDRLGLLAPELIVEGRSGRRLLDRHLDLQVAERGRGSPVVAGAPFAMTAPGTSTSAGLRSQVVLHKDEQICSAK